MKEILKYFFITFIVLSACYYTYKNNFFDLLGSKPKLEIIGNKIINFGIIKKDDLTEHYFKYQNIGDKNLIIYNVETTCGCTVSTWNKEPINTNKIDSIKTTYDSSILGRFEKSIIIYSNSEKKTTELRIIGEVIDHNKR